MGLLVHRSLAIPLSAIALLTVALAAPAAATQLLVPPATVFVVAALGIAAMGFFALGAIPIVRASRVLVPIPPSDQRQRASQRTVRTRGISVRALDEPSPSAAEDALDLVRMDDDGGPVTAAATVRLENGAPTRAASTTTFNQARPLFVPGPLRRAAAVVGDLTGAVVIVLCIPFVILAIGTPIALSLRLLLWLGGLL